MAIVKFTCDCGGSIHSGRTRTIDTIKDLGLGEGEWEEMNEDQRYKEVEQWAWNTGLAIYYEEA